MAKSTFGSSFAQTFQQSLAAARKAEDEQKADKRFNERLAEQRAYGVMEDTKKEARVLGATAKQLETYSGAENQYALDRRMDELRAEYAAGIDASRTGKPLYAPDTETGTGEGTIQPSAGFQRGFENQQAATNQIKFKAETENEIAAQARDILKQERDTDRLNKVLAWGSSRNVPLDFNQPIDKIEQDQAEVVRMEAHNIDRMKAGLPPLPVSELSFNVTSIAKPTEDSFKEIFNADQRRNFEAAKRQAEASVSGQIEARNNQAALRALSDKNLPKEYQALFDEPDFVKKHGALTAQYYDNQALGEAGKVKNDNDLDHYRRQKDFNDSYEIIKGAESLGIKPETDKNGLVTPDFKSLFLSKYVLITRDRTQTDEKGKTIIDNLTGREMTEKVTEWTLRKPPTDKKTTGKPILIPGLRPGAKVSEVPTGK